MPSAANVKIDKLISSENSINEASSNSVTPLRQAITTVEHKIRNLEKRKAKLESYRELQNSGKDLNQDQKTAVAKYDEVVQTLEFARELAKQFLSIATVSEKEAKKQARKEAIARSQTELAKVREVLLVQDALTQMGQENIRDDFLNGRNGAAMLSLTDLKLLDDLYLVVTPKHEPGDSQIFCDQVQAAAEHLLAVVDGKPKEAFGGTYSQIKDVIGKIHESGYFDQAQEPVYDEAVEPEPVLEVSIPEVLNHDICPQPDIMPQIETLTIEAIPPIQQVPQTPIQVVEPPMEQLPPEQQIYYQQPPRPITEVLGTGSFFFLQDSELDTPPEQIPSQTFTNQSYVSVPPPPIPMPPQHFQAFPTNPPSQPVPQQQFLPPGNGVEEHHDIQDDAHKQKGRSRPNNQPFYSNNNGYNNRPRQNRNGPRPGNRHNQ